MKKEPNQTRGPLAQACFDMAEAMMEERRKRHGLDRLRATIGPGRFVRCESQVVRVRGSPRCVDLQPGRESHHRTFKKKTLKNLTVVAIGACQIYDLSCSILMESGTSWRTGSKSFKRFSNGELSLLD